MKTSISPIEINLPFLFKQKKLQIFISKFLFVDKWLSLSSKLIMPVPCDGDNERLNIIFKFSVQFVPVADTADTLWHF